MAQVCDLSCSRHYCQSYCGRKLINAFWPIRVENLTPLLSCVMLCLYSNMSTNGKQQMAKCRGLLWLVFLVEPIMVLSKCSKCMLLCTCFRVKQDLYQLTKYLNICMHIQYIQYHVHKHTHTYVLYIFNLILTVYMQVKWVLHLPTFDTQQPKNPKTLLATKHIANESTQTQHSYKCNNPAC